MDQQKPLNCLLTIVVPKALEEQLIDQLLERPDWVVGFTSYRVEGHGSAVKHHSLAEEVRGRSARLQVQMVMNTDDADLLIRQLRIDLPNPEVVYWKALIAEFGDFA